LLILSLFSIPVFGAVSENEINKIAENHKFSNEFFEIYGPYTYLGHPYILIEYFPIGEEGMTTGPLVVDSKTGKVINDIETAKKIITAHAVAEINSPQLMNRLKNDSEYYAQQQSWMDTEVKTVEASSEVMKSEPKFAEIIEVNKKVRDMYQDLKENRDEALIFIREINAGNKSYENAKKYLELEEKHISKMEELVILRGEFRAQAVIYYDLGMTIGYNSNRYSWERGKEEYLLGIDMLTNAVKEDKKIEEEFLSALENYINFSTESMEMRLKEEAEIPGFGILIAVCAILAAGIITKRRKV